jgi:glycosyltransferase involved in cell wall biosynthesis
MYKRRIVIVNDSSVARGGATTLALSAATALAARGNEVVFLCGDAGDGGALAGHGVEVVALGGQRLLQSRSAMWTGIRNAAARNMVARFLSERDTPQTVYHVHGWAQILSPELFAALAPVARRTLIHSHDMFLACPNGVYMDYRRHEVCHRVPLSFGCLATNCDKRSHPHKLWRVARQRALRQRLDLSLGWAGILTIHPAMIPRLARAGYPESMMTTLRNPVVPFSHFRIRAEDNRGFVYVGRLEEDKGVRGLAEAATRVGVRLTLIGDGPLRATLTERHPDVRITGWVDRRDIGALVADARALVMPSRHPEPFALVIAEAATSGLPVLVADTALMAAEVAEAGLGFAVDVFDPDSFDAALSRIDAAPAADIRAMSETGFSGTPPLGTTPEGWIDGLEVAYDRARAAATA